MHRSEFSLRPKYTSNGPVLNLGCNLKRIIFIALIAFSSLSKLIKDTTCNYISQLLHISISIYWCIVPIRIQLLPLCNFKKFFFESLYFLPIRFYLQTSCKCGCRSLVFRFSKIVIKLVHRDLNVTAVPLLCIVQKVCLENLLEICQFQFWSQVLYLTFVVIDFLYLYPSFFRMSIV